jgi:hypothetical protein
VSVCRAGAKSFPLGLGKDALYTGKWVRMRGYTTSWHSIWSEQRLGGKHVGIVMPIASAGR